MISSWRCIGLSGPGLSRSLAASRSLSLKPNFSKLKKIPQPPGFVVGTVNDAYVHPTPNHYEGGYHWTYDRAIAIAMVPMALTPFVAGVEYPIIDTMFCCGLLFHCHSGFKSCIIDYIPRRVYGVWHGLASKLLALGTAVGLYGIYVLETANNGLFDLVKSVWYS
ncbi:hypothetical protein PGUG_00504 [Meyerozyma guilliermondii ATCC 6260]|uniref:Succinate dehydrogenase [ubiquinone] cytochrome b small subunit n=1 Tax=Meyerozyma guilliermondii (strain ATCC 6260 / CBS 566 / DSM 6381 / JCM 1539 / NBRC 10279 / NRRL Y-324) TaxID=294746 RepID=A5DB49_PICGU|nr:uncharacterized protein PGUG_00504 [Meyerozyma guilliermondii ATCC 6260]EDK36406.2 hypothetical protein PGUG_00504 [Meyerozyma guilliermondii ATCC 6260]